MAVEKEIHVDFKIPTLFDALTPSSYTYCLLDRDSVPATQREDRRRGSCDRRRGVGTKKVDSRKCVGFFQYIPTTTGSCNVGHDTVYIQGSRKTTGTASD